MDLLTAIPDTIQPEALERALLLLATGFPLGWLLGRGAGRALAHAGRPSFSNLVRRSLMLGVVGLTTVMALEQLGFDLSVFMGAAGVVTVALGFASQTSASNLISGLFLLSEGSISLGETIRVGQVTGEIVSIDWLSVKLRTVDNTFVRVPNETLVKSEIWNLTRYPIRRVDLVVTVGFEVEVEDVRRILEGVADAEPRVLREPEPAVVATTIGRGTIDIQLSVWVPTDVTLEVRSLLVERIQDAFRAASIVVSPERRSIDVR